MAFELFVALRYLREGRAQTVLILAGATVGIAILVFVTALVGGLKASFVRQTLSAQAYVLVKAPERSASVLPGPASAAVIAHVSRAPDRVRSIPGWQQVLSTIEHAPGVVAAAPTVAGSAFASRGEATRAVALRGVDPETFATVIDIVPRVTQGEFDLDGTDAAIGSVLASDLGIGTGDKIRLATPGGRGGLFTVRAIFDMGNRDVNQRWVLVSLRSGQTLLDLDGGVTTIEVRVDDAFEADRIASRISARHALAADSWMKTNSQLLAALRSQAMSGYLIQVLVIAAVAMAIASVLGVSVVQKAREIGILRATGTTASRIRTVFLIQGAIVGITGSLGGSLLGILMAAGFANMARRPTGEPLFPVQFHASQVAVAALVAVCTGLCAAYLPARRAARLDPAVVIRNG